MQTQLAVLGGGPGGYAAAFLAADLGMEVTLVEQEPRLGGTCLLRGCIPSKALLHVAHVLDTVEGLRSDWGIEFSSPSIKIDNIRQRKEKLLATLSTGLGQLAKRRNVRRITARGRLLDSNTLELQSEEKERADEGTLSFENLILATGSTPAVPKTLALDTPRVMDSDGALQLDEIPESLLVIGGGYIGLELGTVYASLGSTVTIVELTDSLLPGIDADLVKPLHRRLKRLLGNRIFLKTEVRSLLDTGDTVEVVMAGPEGETTEQFARVLVAVGRRPASNALGLENSQVEVDSDGFVVCDQQQRTKDPSIFAVGDIAGEPMLAHKAIHQGKVAVQTILGESVSFGPKAIPAVVFTDPEIAWAGLTLDQAKQANLPIEIAVYPWGASGRAHALGRTEGLTRWIIDPSSRKLIGCGIVGSGAGELISESVLAIEKGCTVDDLAHAIHPHPTLSETLGHAADSFLGTATEIYKPKRR